MTIVEELRTDRESGARRLESEYKAGLMSLARRFCADEGDAEELVNRTLAAVVEGIDDYLEQSAFFGWICKILENLHAKDVRRKSSRTVAGDTVAVEGACDDDACDRIFREVDASLLRDAISDLPADMKESVVLRYFMDLPVAKIARFLALPEGTVMWRLHCARKILAAKLGAAARRPGARLVLLALLLAAGLAVGRGVYALASAALSSRAESAEVSASTASTVSTVPTVSTASTASTVSTASTASTVPTVSTPDLSAMNAKPFLAAAASLTLATAPAAANQWIYDSSARTLSWTDSSGFENKIENVTVVSGTQNKLQVGNNKSNAKAVNLDFSPGIADGYELHRFETGAFLGNNSVTNLVCPPSLRIIGWASFESTKNLVWVDLNEGLTSFDSQRSFYESGVHAISRIPSTLTSLGVNTFRGTTSLTNDIVWPDTVESYPQMFFYGSGIGSFTARKGLKTIGTYALGKNNHLTNVVLSMDLKSIGSSMLSEITKAQFHCDVWWRNFPEGGFSSMWANGDFAQYAITNHFEWNSRGKWAEFAATNSGWNLTLPPTFNGVGDLYVNYRHHVVLWWKDPDQRGSPTVIIVK